MKTNLEIALEVLSDPNKKFVYRYFIGSNRIYLDEHPHAQFVGFRTNAYFVWVSLSDNTHVRLTNLTDNTMVILQDNDDLMYVFQRENDKEIWGTEPPKGR